jgi:hypothetical protein
VLARLALQALDQPRPDVVLTRLHRARLAGVEQGDDRPGDLARRALVDEGAGDLGRAFARLTRSFSFALPSGSPPFGLTTWAPVMFEVSRVAPPARVGIAIAAIRAATPTAMVARFLI